MHIRHAVDGCEILHQLKTVVYPIIYRVSTIQGGAGFLNHPPYVYAYIGELPISDGEITLFQFFRLKSFTFIIF